MAERRRGLGRGLGALIPPDGPATAERSPARPTDVFFAERSTASSSEDAPRRRRAEGRGRVIELPRDADAERPDGPAPDAAERDASSSRRGSDPRDVPSPRDAADVDEDPVGGDLPVLRRLPVAEIVANPRQPRREFDREAMDELVHSVREIGVLQPVVVRPAPRPREGARYEIVMGERRWRASVAAGLETVPAVVRATPDDDLLRDALLENLHRSELNPLEEAAAYQQLLEDFGCTHDQLAERLGRSRPQVTNTLRLLRLPTAVQRRVATGALSAGHARALLGLGGPALESMADRVLREGLSVRATEQAVAASTTATPRTAPGPVALPGLDDLVGVLSDRLSAPVRVAMGARRGRLVVEFSGVEDLQRILAALGTGDRAGQDPVGADLAERDMPERDLAGQDPADDGPARPGRRARAAAAAPTTGAAGAAPSPAVAPPASATSSPARAPRRPAGARASAAAGSTAPRRGARAPRTGQGG